MRIYKHTRTANTVAKLHAHCRYKDKIQLIGHHLKDKDKTKILQRLLLGETTASGAGAAAAANEVASLSVERLCSMTQADMMMSEAEKQLTKQRQVDHMKRKIIDANVSMSSPSPTAKLVKKRKITRTLGSITNIRKKKITK